MKLFFKIAAVVALAVVTAYSSYKLLIVMAVMAFGVAIATAIEKEKKDFRASVVFHKCCVTAQWVFISFYLFGIDRLPAGSWVRKYSIAMIPISGLLYIALAKNTHGVLGALDPEFLKTRAEKVNAILAFISLVVMLVFAYHLERL